MIPALLGAATIGASLYNSQMQAQSQRELRQSQLDLYKRHRADTIELMDRQNLYNSPSAQMDRLRDAGLNPHLIYSGGATNPSVSASPAAPPQLQPMGHYLDPSAFSQVAQMFYQSEGLALQNKNLELQNRGLEAEVKLKERQGNLLDEQAISEITNRQNTISQTELNYQAYKFNSQLKALEVDLQSLDYQQRKILYPLHEMNAILQNEKLRADVINVRTMTLADKLLKGAQLSEIKQKVKLSEQEYQFLDAVNDFRVINEKFEAGFNPSDDTPLGNLKAKWTVKHVGDMVSSFFKFFK